MHAVAITSGSITSETGGGQIFADIFQRPFLGVSRQNFSISSTNFIYLPKFLMTFFLLVIDIFHLLICYFFLRGAKTVTDINTGGQNSYVSTNSQCYHYSSCLQGESQTPLPTSMGGAMAGFAPPGSATGCDRNLRGSAGALAMNGSLTYL